MPFPMILADANCSNMNTLLTGCFSNNTVSMTIKSQ